MTLSTVGNFASTALDYACTHPRKTLFLGATMAIYMYSSEISAAAQPTIASLAKSSPRMRAAFEELDLVSPLPTKWQQVKASTGSVVCFVTGYSCSKAVEEVSSITHTLGLYALKAAALLFAGKLALNYSGLGKYGISPLLKK